MTARDRRALTYLAVAIILAAAYQFWPTGGVDVAASTESVETSEQRLARLRRIAATTPAKEEFHKTVTAELAARETGLIRADTGAQAQAQMMTLLTELAAEDGIQIRPTELRNTIAPLGDAYGEASVTIQFQCHIEQLVNFLAALSSRPEILVTQDLQINNSDAKQKTLAVRLAISGVVPRELVPSRDKKGA
jgi:Tfp pilus assembly protein PilO